MNAADWLTVEERQALLDLLSLLVQRKLPEPLLVGAVAIRTRIPRDDRLEASREPDLAVQAASMAEFDGILQAATAFDARREGYRLLHRETGVGIDLVPFGGLEHPAGQVSFPGRTLMVAGFREAWQLAERLMIGEGLAVRVPTAPFLLALKLFAFHDRRAPKDLADAQRLMRALPQPADPWSDDLLLERIAERRLDAGDLALWSAARQLRHQLAEPSRALLRSIVRQLTDADFPTRAPLRLLSGAGDDVDERDAAVRHQLTVLALALETDGD
jgi:predicted nucleotidyltransferase